MYSKKEVEELTLKYFKGDDLATQVWIKKYCLKDEQGNLLEKSPDDMHRRMAKEFVRIEATYPNSISEEEIYQLFKDFKYVVPGGSQAAGIGNNLIKTSLSNCFVIDSAVDSYGGIFQADQEQVQIMKRRGGVGHDISNIRPSGMLANNSLLLGSAGQTLYMERFSNSTREVAQDNRRGALMLSTHVNHPDCDKFIDMKMQSGKVTGANVSVKISDEFMDLMEANLDFYQTFPIEKSVHELHGKELIWGIEDGLDYDKLNLSETIKSGSYKKINPKLLWDKIIHNAWKSAEPGVLFWDTILRESPAGCYGEEWKETSTNPCLSGDTWVTTDKGPRQINDLIGVGQIRLLKDGKFYETTNEGFFKTGDLLIFELKLANGYKIRSTDNHKFLTDRGWKELKNIAIGDKIALSLNEDIEWAGIGGSKEEGWLIGNFIGDGHFVHDKYANLQYWGDDKERMISKALNLLESIGHTSQIEKKPACHSDLVCNKTSVNSKELYQCARKWGVKVKNKYLTREIEIGSSEFYKGVIGGLFDADGCVWLNNGCITIDISQSNLPLLEQTQRMLSRLGILSTICFSHKGGLKLLPGSKYYENGEMKEYLCKDNYILRISNKFNAEKFFDKIYILDEDKLLKYENLAKNHPKKYKVRKFSAVKSISALEVGPVYDCTIPEVSCFDANGIITHNCGEIPLCPYDSCRLTAINLYSYVTEPFTSRARFDFPLFRKHVNQAQRIMDDLIDLEIEKIDIILNKIESDPESEDIKRVELNLWKKIREKAVQGRRTGLGITAEGDTLAALGFRYGTKEATEFAVIVHKELAIESYKASIQMAEERGAFPIWDGDKEINNPFLDRIYQTLDSTTQLNWGLYGRRNIANLTIAPVGTGSLMTQSTSGIEPLFQPFYKRRTKTDDKSKAVYIDEMGDGWLEYFVLHPKFIEWFRINYWDKVEDHLGIASPKEWLEKCSESNLQGYLEVSPYYKATANDIDWEESVRMQGAVQKWIDHSISKTVNLPAGATIETVDKVYRAAYHSGCKGVTIYRDGCRQGVLLTGKEEKKEIFEYKSSFKRPQKLECDIYHKVALKQDYMIIVGKVNGNPYEIFALRDVENCVFPTKIEKGYLTKVKSRTYELTSELQGKTFKIANIVTLMTADQSTDTRKYSSMLRHGMHPQYIVNQIDEYASIVSFDKVVQRVLKNYIKEEQKKEKCPECGSEHYHSDSGCFKCDSCGYSKCG